jgi:hypothetical protein
VADWQALAKNESKKFSFRHQRAGPSPNQSLRHSTRFGRESLYRSYLTEDSEVRLRAPAGLGSSHQNDVDASVLAPLPVPKCKQKSSSYAHLDHNISDAHHEPSAQGFQSHGRAWNRASQLFLKRLWRFRLLRFLLLLLLMLGWRLGLFWRFARRLAWLIRRGLGFRFRCWCGLGRFIRIRFVRRRRRSCGLLCRIASRLISGGFRRNGTARFCPWSGSRVIGSGRLCRYHSRTA